MWWIFTCTRILSTAMQWFLFNFVFIRIQYTIFTNTCSLYLLPHTSIHRHLADELMSIFSFRSCAITWIISSSLPEASPAFGRRRFFLIGWHAVRFEIVHFDWSKGFRKGKFQRGVWNRSFWLVKTLRKSFRAQHSDWFSFECAPWGS